MKHTPARKRAAPTPQILLRAAADIMIEFDTVDISIEEIATKANVNSALVRYYFGSKIGLLKELFWRETEGQLPALQALVRSNLPPAEKMTRHLNALAKVLMQKPFMTPLGTHLMRYCEPADSQAVADALHGSMKAYAAIIEEGKQRGDFKDIDPLAFHLAATGALEKLAFSKYLRARTVGEQMTDKNLNIMTNSVVPMLVRSLLRDPS